VRRTQHQRISVSGRRSRLGSHLATRLDGRCIFCNVDSLCEHCDTACLAAPPAKRRSLFALLLGHAASFSAPDADGKPPVGARRGALGFLLAFLARNFILALVPSSIPLPRHVSLMQVCSLSRRHVHLGAVLFGLAPAFRLSLTSTEGHLQESGGARHLPARTTVSRIFCHRGICAGVRAPD